MSIEGAPQPEQSRFKVGDKVRLPEKYLMRGVAGYTDQKPEGWVIVKMILSPEPLYGPEPYAIVQEDNGKWTAGSVHVPLAELEVANPEN